LSSNAYSTHVVKNPSTSPSIFCPSELNGVKLTAAPEKIAMPSVRFATPGMQRFVGVEFDGADVEGAVVELAKMRFDVDGVVLFVIMLEAALEAETLGSLVEDEDEDDEAWNEDEY
jgi:hypothetical protein